MKHDSVRATSFAMPLTNPAFPPGPYRFVNREYFIIQYRTDVDALRRIVPEPLELTEPVVNYEFIRMPDFDRLRRLHRKRSGYPGVVPGRDRQLRPSDVPQ